MTSKTDICNRALIKLGKDTIRNIDTDESQAGTLCRAVYDTMLTEVLRQFEWNFAIVRQTLNRDMSDDPLFEWSYRFILPTIPQLVKILGVENNVPFKIEGEFLVTNSDTINLKYIGKIADPNKYDVSFQETLSLAIAKEICFTMTSQTTLKDNLTKEYLFSLQNAKDANYNDTNEIPIQNNSWTNARIIGLSNSNIAFVDPNA